MSDRPPHEGPATSPAAGDGAPAPGDAATPAETKAKAPASSTGEAAATTEVPSTVDAQAQADDVGDAARSVGRVAPSRRRISILVVAGAVLILAAVLITRTPRRASPSASAPPMAGGAALRAPEGPRITTPSAGARLSGFVVDGAGAPVVGAEVVTDLEELAPAAGSAPAAPVALIAPVDPLTWPLFGGSGAALHVAPLTGADGSFVVDGLAPGRYRVRVTGVGLIAAEVRFVPVPSEATRIVVARQVSVEGVVTDGDKPAINVTVGLRGEAIGGAIEVKSGVTGAFAFPALPEGRYQLFAWHGALAARTIRVQRLGVGPFAPVELRLEAATIVVGRVIDRAEGLGLQAAIELRSSADDEAPRYVRSGTDGVFRIEGVPNGRWIADAYAHGYVSAGGVELDAGRGVPEIALARGAVITGRVLDGAGLPIAGAIVRGLGTGPGGTEYAAAVEQDQLWRFSGRTVASTQVGEPREADPLWIARGELGVLSGPIPPLPLPGTQPSRTAIVDPVFSALAGEPPPLALDDPTRAPIWTTGADGRYRIWGLGKAKLHVLAVAPGFAEGRSAAISVDPPQVVTDVDVILTAGTFVVGRVTDQHGVPVVGARIAARPEAGASLDAFTDLAGTFRIGPLVGTIELSATAYGHGEARARVELEPPRGALPGAHPLDLVLVLADAVLAGTLDDGNGTPVAGAQLELLGGAGNGRHAIVAADGTFSFDLLPPGPQRIRIRHPAYPTHEVEGIASTGGRERARLTLPLGGAVEGAVLDASGGTPLTGITVVGAGPMGARADATTDARGQFRLGPLAGGAWKLTVKLAGYLPLEEAIAVIPGRLPGDTTARDVRLELARGALVGGTVRDRRGQRMAAVEVAVQRRGGEGPIALGKTDAAGEFRLRDCPTGDVVVTATHGTARGVTQVTVRPGDEVLGLAIDLE